MLTTGESPTVVDGEEIIEETAGANCTKVREVDSTVSSIEGATMVSPYMKT